MKRSFGLVVTWVLFLGVMVSRADDPPNCESCECYEAEAWGEKQTNPGGAVVLTTYDKDNPNDFGTVVKDARWQTGNTTSDWFVFASPGLKDFHMKWDDDTYRQWDYKVNWERECIITDAVPPVYYAYVPLKYVASSNRTKGALAYRYWCGPQD